MRILELAHTDTSNEFMENLVQGIRREGVKVDCNPHGLQIRPFNYEIIHLHWPEAIFDWRFPSQFECTELKKTILELRSQGVKIVWTIHNERPHSKNQLIQSIYDFFLLNVDCCIHLGQSSLVTYQGNFGAIQHVQIDHPSYKVPSINEIEYSQRKGKFQVLVFGTIREFRERNLIYSLFKLIKVHHDVQFIITGWRFAQLASWFQDPLSRIKEEFISKFANRENNFKIIDQAPITPLDRDYLFHHVDLCIIPRLDTLNSGLPYLSLSYGLPFLAPDVGNIGSITRSSDNYIYNPNDINAAAIVLSKVISNRNERIDKLAKNKSFANTNLSNELIGQQHKVLFKSIIQ